MGTPCLSSCPECARHVRCGERACPFCGANVQFFMRVADYRVTTRLSRGRMLVLGAALAAAGFACSNDDQVVAIYGAPCNPPECNNPPDGGTTTGGTAGTGGTASTSGTGGSAGTGDHGGEGGEGGAAR